MTDAGRHQALWLEKDDRNAKVCQTCSYHTRAGCSRIVTLQMVMHNDIPAWRVPKGCERHWEHIIMNQEFSPKCRLKALLRRLWERCSA